MLRKIPYLLNVVAILVTVGLAAYYYPKLPDRLASHFGTNGQPDGWTDKSNFIAIMLSLQVGLAVFMSTLTWLIRKLPASMVNIPHREYWLHEDRAEETTSWLGQHLNWINAATSVFLTLIFQLTIESNLMEKVQLSSPSFFIILGLYFLVISIFLGKILLKFTTIPPSNQT